MELRVLHYFLAVAREQSISAAAQSLHLTQPTLSTQLKALEEELGKQLLVRGTKGSRKVTLTEEGMILRKRAEEILTLVNKAEEEIAHSDDTVVGTVSIGAVWPGLWGGGPAEIPVPAPACQGHLGRPHAAGFPPGGEGGHHPPGLVGQAPAALSPAGRQRGPVPLAKAGRLPA